MSSPTKKHWVITTTLNNNLLKAKLPPLLEALPDLEIIFVSDRAGPEMNRVRWVVPPSWLHKLAGRLISREVVLWREISRKSVERVMVYNAVPHLLLAYPPAKWFGKKLDLHLIAGRLDLDFADRPDVMVNRVVRRLKSPRGLQKLVRKWAFGYCARLFAPGIRAREFLLEQGISPERIVNIHSAVNPTVYSPDGSVRDIDVLVISNLQKRKRPELTIRILENVLKRKPDAKFVWIGDGHMRDDVHRLVESSSLRDSLIMVGHTDDVLSYDRRAKIFLLNSLSEGLSCACMEAMAAGVVPVSSDVGDMAEIVRTGETGTLIEKHDDPLGYADAILALLEDESERERFAKNGRDLILREHSFEAIREAWRRLESEK
ncbi:glycosyltransferase family 4 protein [bacterium]|nr:glycosyltransferase family 4 protein [bacterium]